jgi:hypothetical protein
MEINNTENNIPDVEVTDTFDKLKSLLDYSNITYQYLEVTIQ